MRSDAKSKGRGLHLHEKGQAMPNGLDITAIEIADDAADMEAVIEWQQKQMVAALGISPRLLAREPSRASTECLHRGGADAKD